MVKKISKRRGLYIGLVLFAVTAGLIAVLEATDTTHIFHQTKAVPITAGQQTKGEPATSNSTTTGPSQTSGEKTSMINSSAYLIEPNGNFVSNHHPNLSGSPAPNLIQSNCNTTPGASCQIIFEKTGTIKKLPAQVVDGGGATYWTWKLQDYGITTGSWTVKAEASLNGNSKTATDALTLEVTQ